MTTSEEWAEVRLLLENGFRPTADGHWERRISKQELVWWNIAEGISNGTFIQINMIACECGH